MSFFLFQLKYFFLISNFQHLLFASKNLVRWDGPGLRWFNRWSFRSPCQLVLCSTCPVVCLCAADSNQRRSVFEPGCRMLSTDFTWLGPTVPTTYCNSECRMGNVMSASFCISSHFHSTLQCTWCSDSHSWLEFPSSCLEQETKMWSICSWHWRRPTTLKMACSDALSFT